MKTVSEMSLRTLADDELTAVAGGRHLRRLPWPGSKSVKQSNSVGDVYVDASDNSGSVSVSISQSNSSY